MVEIVEGIAVLLVFVADLSDEVAKDFQVDFELGYEVQVVQNCPDNSAFLMGIFNLCDVERPISENGRIVFGGNEIVLVEDFLRVE
jgi:hypothetical protein